MQPQREMSLLLISLAAECQLHHPAGHKVKVFLKPQEVSYRCRLKGGGVWA